VSPLFALAQGDLELGFGVLGSTIVVDPIPASYRGDFVGPITYLGYYVEASTLLSENEKWKPRAVLRLQSEGSNPSIDWPEIRVLSASAGCLAGYQLTPVISFLAGGFVNYQLSTRIQSMNDDMPVSNSNPAWGAKVTGGVRGDFGRWSTVSKEGATSFRPSYSFLNVQLGLKYALWSSSKNT